MFSPSSQDVVGVTIQVRSAFARRSPSCLGDRIKAGNFTDCLSLKLLLIVCPLNFLRHREPGGTFRRGKPVAFGEAAPGVIETTGGRSIDETGPAGRPRRVSAWKWRSQTAAIRDSESIQVDIVDHRAQVITPDHAAARVRESVELDSTHLEDRRQGASPFLRSRWPRRRSPPRHRRRRKIPASQFRRGLPAPFLRR